MGPFDVFWINRTRNLKQCLKGKTTQITTRNKYANKSSISLFLSDYFQRTNFNYSQREKKKLFLFFN